MHLRQIIVTYTLKVVCVYFIHLFEIVYDGVKRGIFS